MWLKTSMAAVVSAALLSASPGQTETYNFDMTFDGSDLLLDPGADNPHLVELVPSDIAFLRVRAKGTSFWEVTSDLIDAYYPMTMRVEAPGIRTSDIFTDWKLDGAVVAEQDDVGILQKYRHIGAEFWTLDVGTIFDEVLITLALQSGSNTTKLLSEDPDILKDFGNTLFFRDGPQNGGIEYFSGPPAPISLPPGLPLLASGIAGLFLLVWLKRTPAPGSSRKTTTA